MIRAPNMRKQRGAALVIVLLLVATLSFIVLSISERTVMAASRATNARTRSELLWRAFGVEALAAAAIKASVEASPEKMTREDPLFAEPVPTPMEDGGALIAVSDRTACFNLNSLVTEAGGGAFEANEAAAIELAAILTTQPDNSFDVEAFTASITDWIDSDSFQEPKGAEDGFYAGLPTPYRTGAALLADVSELRAIAGVARGAYLTALDSLCVQPTAKPSPINVNMLEVGDAPLLVGLVPDLTLAEALDVIAATPPGGYEATDAFWENPAFAGMEIAAATRERVTLTSRFVEAYAAITYADASADIRILFEVGDNGETRLISRRLGRYE